MDRSLLLIVNCILILFTEIVENRTTRHASVKLCSYSQPAVLQYQKTEENISTLMFFWHCCLMMCFFLSSSLHFPVKNQFLAVDTLSNNSEHCRKSIRMFSSWEKKQPGSAALPALTTNRHTGVQSASEHKVCFLYSYVRAAQCVLSVVTDCSSTLTRWLSIRSSPLRWKVT